MEKGWLQFFLEDLRDHRGWQKLMRKHVLMPCKTKSTMGLSVWARRRHRQAWSISGVLIFCASGGTSVVPVLLWLLVSIGAPNLWCVMYSQVQGILGPALSCHWQGHDLGRGMEHARWGRTLWVLAIYKLCQVYFLSVYITDSNFTTAFILRIWERHVLLKMKARLSCYLVCIVQASMPLSIPFSKLQPVCEHPPQKKPWQNACL